MGRKACSAGIAGPGIAGLIPGYSLAAGTGRYRESLQGVVDLEEEHVGYWQWVVGVNLFWRQVARELPGCVSR